MDITKNIYQKITSCGLTQKGDIVVVGVSGGPDSVALLDVLYQLRYSLGINLHVAHFNHRLRVQSNKDEAFVRNLSEKLHLPFHVQRRKGESKDVSEDKARQWRFSFFLKVARQTGAACIALAHTQNDLAETVLMRILRGSGLLGLGGILSQKEMVQIKFIRPFIEVSRRDIEHYLKVRQLEFCVDETNQQTHYFRNKIRLDLLPHLIKNYNPNFSQVLLDLAKTSQADYGYIYEQAQRLFKRHCIVSKLKIQWKLSFFLKQHLGIRRMLLRLSFDHLSGSLNQLSFRHIEEVEEMLVNKPVGSVVNWPKSVVVYKTKTGLFLTLR